MIVINKEEKKIVLKLPDEIEKEISLIPVEEQVGQCKQKIFYDKKNLPVWDRWGKDVAKIVGGGVAKIIAAGINSAI